MILPEWLDALDKDLFSLINSRWAIPSLDWFMKALRNAITWIPLYAFILFWGIRYGKQNAWKFCLLSILTFAITDYTSASILKPFLGRLRPCHDVALQTTIRTLVPCGGSFSLPSTHATNHFGLATFWFYSVFFISNRKWHWLWIWAFAIGYAQIYVGKHYPFDILLGAILGLIVGFLTALLFRRWMVHGSRPH